jgi:hypothetical protein
MYFQGNEISSMTSVGMAERLIYPLERHSLSQPVRLDANMEMSTFHIAKLRINDTEPAGVVRGGVLVGTGPWRVHVQTTRDVGWAEGAAHFLDIATLEGERLIGRAVLRQTDGKGHLFLGEDQLERHSGQEEPHG